MRPVIPVLHQQKQHQQTPRPLFDSSSLPFKEDSNGPTAAKHSAAAAVAPQSDPDEQRMDYSSTHRGKESSSRRRGSAAINASSSSSYLDRQTTQPQHHRLASQQSWPQHQNQQQSQQQQPSTAAAAAAASLYAQSQQPSQPAIPLYGAGRRGGYPQTSQDMLLSGDQQMLEAAADFQQQEFLRQQRQQPASIQFGTRDYTAQQQQQQYQQQLAFQQQQQQQQQQINMLNAAVAAAATIGGPPQQPLLQHQLDVLQMQQQQLPDPLVAGLAAAVAAAPPQQPYLQPRIGRLPADRPLMKLSVNLIDTYKQINTVYYQERDARRVTRAKEKAAVAAAQSTAPAVAAAAAVGGVNNHGWDDDNHDYLITPGEVFYGRYRIKERIGKGSFGQVVRAEDMETNCDVAVKIIKSKKPFLMQAKTEIELLEHLNNKDPDDHHNVVRLLTNFMYRNHQCLVFEMLSINLYELLKITQFGGVSIKLIRKFARQVLKSLQFLARPDVDIIHCDLKPENILMRHPKKSGVKVIDFGSSCRSNKRMYSYIQSRFYRSPEVILGLPYAASIDMWSLGCILAEMHTGEPLFSGSDQFDQMQKIVTILGMLPTGMLERSSDQHRMQFFEKRRDQLGREVWTIKQTKGPAPSRQSAAASYTAAASKTVADVCIPSTSPIDSLTELITADNQRKKKYPSSETDNTPENYEMFVDLINRMLTYDPKQRIRPDEALSHPFIVGADQQQQQGAFSQRR